MAWMWLRQAVVAHRALVASGPEAPTSECHFYLGKLAAARHVFAHELPKTAAMNTLLRTLDPSLVELDDAWL
jgi:hypothetical protein